jgi:drug/metabolite transporter (DMT)-like permease
MTALYPLVTVGLAIAFLKERPTPLEWLGIIVALAGGAMLSYETVPGETAQSAQPERNV